MAYGTPTTPADVEPYYTRIRHGRAPTPELLADLVRRYNAIGGTSPLAERTAAQVRGIARKYLSKLLKVLRSATAKKLRVPSFPWISKRLLIRFHTATYKMFSNFSILDQTSQNG